VGFWLATTVALGSLLWWNKRRRKDARRTNAETVETA